MLKAIILDCDGVIADTEPIHFRAFRKTLDEEGIELTEEDYFGQYVGLNDRDCFQAILSEQGSEPDPEQITDLVERKSKYYDEYIQDLLIIYPGVKELVEQAAAGGYLLAVVSGALKQEVEFILERAGIRSHISAVVSAEDVSRGKPDPEGYLKAFEILKRDSSDGLAPQECVVFEDTDTGIDAARAAGMWCIGVAQTYPKEALSRAHSVVASMEEMNLKKLERLYENMKAR